MRFSHIFGSRLVVKRRSFAMLLLAEARGLGTPFICHKPAERNIPTATAKPNKIFLTRVFIHDLNITNTIVQIIWLLNGGCPFGYKDLNLSLCAIDPLYRQVLIRMGVPRVTGAISQ